MNALRSDVLTEVGIKITVLWNVRPRNLIHRYQHIRRTFRLHLQGKRLCRAALLWDARCSRQLQNYFLLGWYAVHFCNQRSWGTFCLHLHCRKMLLSSHRISTRDTRFPGSVKIIRKVTPCSVRTIVPGEHVLPERWTLRNLPKLQFTPMFRNTLHHIPEECNRHVLWRHSKQKTWDFQTKTWNL